MKDNNILYTVLGIGILVALYFYIKKNFGFGLGGLGDGSGGNASAPSIGNPVGSGTKSTSVGTALAKGFALHKGGIGLGTKDAATRYAEVLQHVDAQCSLHMQKFAKDPIVAQQLKAVNDLPDDVFRSAVGQWLINARYKTVLDSYIFKSLDRDEETAIFINRVTTGKK